MIILFKCNTPACKNYIKKFFRKASEIPLFLDCGECGIGKMERQLESPFSKSTVIIDNGNQQRQVEVDNTVVEQERDKIIKKG